MRTETGDLRTTSAATLLRFAPDRFVARMHGTLSTLEGDDLKGYLEYVLANPEHRRRALAFAPTILPLSARIDGTLNDERWFRDLPFVDYGEIQCPVLVVHGEFDAAVPVSHAEFVAEAVPEAELLRIEADHLAWIGPDADRAGRAVSEFARSVAEPRGEAVQ
ncbi:MAG: alpha/beta fold hydrolase [Salinigranum sp.]